MGKSKKRSLSKNNIMNGSVIRRNEAVEKIILNIKHGNISDETKKYINLFGITVEELSEAGLGYEELSALKYLFI